MPSEFQETGASGYNEQKLSRSQGMTCASKDGLLDRVYEKRDGTENFA
jgi:hypothetical protein